MDNSAAKAPQRIAIVCDTCRLTYGKLAERSCRLARAMLSWGFKGQAHVAILSPNTHSFVEAYFAAMRAGFVVVLVNTRLSAHEITYVLNDSHAEAVVYDSEYEDTVREISGSTPDISVFMSSASQDVICSADRGQPGSTPGSSLFMEPVAESDPAGKA